MILKGPGHGDGTEFVANVVIVSVGAESKIVPDPVMGEFHFRPLCKISSQECKDAVGTLLHSVKNSDNAGEKSSFV